MVRKTAVRHLEKWVPRAPSTAEQQFRAEQACAQRSSEPAPEEPIEVEGRGAGGRGCLMLDLMTIREVAEVLESPPSSRIYPNVVRGNPFFAGERRYGGGPVRSRTW